MIVKRWLAVSLGIGLQVAQAMTPKIKDPEIRQATQAIIVGVTGIIVKKTSETNPDGTPAQAPWEKK